nr:MAG TPA: hypothetical protein [Caudoviricetes sp.]
MTKCPSLRAQPPLAPYKGEGLNVLSDGKTKNAEPK